MYTLQSLEVVRIKSHKEGTLVFAKYPNWYYEYSFLIKATGRVKGKTSAGFWEELSPEATSFIQAKFRSRLSKYH